MEVKLATEIITKPILKHYFRNLRLKHASPAVVQGKRISYKKYIYSIQNK